MILMIKLLEAYSCLHEVVITESCTFSKNYCNNKIHNYIYTMFILNYINVFILDGDLATNCYSNSLARYYF